MLIILLNYQTWWWWGVALHNCKIFYMTLVGGTCESGGKEFDLF